MSGTVIGSLPSPWHAVTDNLRRNRRRMLLAFVGASIMGGTVAGIMPAAYRSESVLMVRLGQEYLVNADPATTSVFMERKEMVASEVAMLTAPELATRVIQEVGLNRIYPSLSETIDLAVPDSEHDAYEEALIKFARHLSVLPVKDSTLISVSFKNRDPQIAAAVLNHLVNDYLEMRKQHFEYANGSALSAELGSDRAELNRVTEQLEQLKQEAKITDLDAQMLRLLDEKAQLVKDRDKVLGDIPALTAQIASLRGALDVIGKSVLLRSESGESDALRDLKSATARLQLKENDLRVQFKDGAPQLDDVRRNVDLAQSLLRNYGRQQATRVATGRPLSYDSVESSLKEAEASLAANQARVVTLTAQISEVDAGSRQLSAYRAHLDQLQREQKTAQDAFFQAAKRLNEARAHDQMMAAAKPNVQVVQAPRAPYRQTITRLIIAIAGIVGGATLAALLAYLDDLGRGRMLGQARP